MRNKHDTTPQTADHSVVLDESADQKPLHKIKIPTVNKKHNDILNPSCSRSKVLESEPCNDTNLSKPIHLKTRPPKATPQDDWTKLEFISQRQRNSPALTKKVGKQNPPYRIGKHVRLDPTVLCASREH